jgi:hypothetical protein
MDAEMADVMITIHEQWADKIDEAALRMQEIGLDVTNIDRANGVIEGSLEIHALKSIEKFEAVAYVRKTFEYDVNYPPGDPRDRDGK